MEKQTNTLKLVPFRIVEFDGEIKPGVDIPTVYEFLGKGSHKEAYQIKIYVDDMNQSKIVDLSCTCPHHTFNECKQGHRHFQDCILELVKYDRLDSSYIQNTSEVKNGR